MSNFAWQMMISAAPRNLNIVASKGSYILNNPVSPPTALLFRTALLTAAKGTFVLSGFTSTGAKVVSMVAATGQYVLSGKSAALSRTEIRPTDPTPYVENAWVPTEGVVDAGETVDMG